MFGIEIIDASLVPAMLVALIAGIISFLSPCVLPIVPPYLAYMSGVTMSELSDDTAHSRRSWACPDRETLWFSWCCRSASSSAATNAKNRLLV